MIFLLSFLLSASAFANEARVVRAIQTVKSDCLARAADDRAVSGCVQRAFDAASSELNRYYSHSVGRMRTDNPFSFGVRLDRLQKSQESWRDYAQQQCSFEASSDMGGSDEMRSQYDCLSDMTLTRLLAIAKVVEGE